MTLRFILWCSYFLCFHCLHCTSIPYLHYSHSFYCRCWISHQTNIYFCGRDPWMWGFASFFTTFPFVSYHNLSPKESSRTAMHLDKLSSNIPEGQILPVNKFLYSLFPIRNAGWIVACCHIWCWSKSWSWLWLMLEISFRVSFACDCTLFDTHVSHPASHSIFPQATYTEFSLHNVAWSLTK